VANSGGWLTAAVIAGAAVILVPEITNAFGGRGSGNPSTTSTTSTAASAGSSLGSALGTAVGDLNHSIANAAPAAATSFLTSWMQAAGVSGVTFAVLSAGAIAVYRNAQLRAYIVKTASTAGQWVVQAISGSNNPPPPPSGGAAAPVSAPQTTTTGSVRTSPGGVILPSSVAYAIANIQFALQQGTAPAARDLTDVVSAIRSGVVTRAAVLAALGTGAVTALRALSGSVASLGPLAALIA
jgi:hypothetical protein